MSRKQQNLDIQVFSKIHHHYFADCSSNFLCFLFFPTPLYIRIYLWFWRYRCVNAGGSDGGAVPRRLPVGTNASIRRQEDTPGGRRFGLVSRFALPAVLVPRSRHHMLHGTWWIARLQETGESIFRSFHPVGCLPLDTRSHFQSNEWRSFLFESHQRFPNCFLPLLMLLFSAFAYYVEWPLRVFQRLRHERTSRLHVDRPRSKRWGN